MPSIFTFGRYVIFFWTSENGEPVHVHVAVRRPTENATKLCSPLTEAACWRTTTAASHPRTSGM